MFSFGTLQVPANSPRVWEKRKIMLALEMVARLTGSTLELSVSNTAA